MTWPNPNAKVIRLPHNASEAEIAHAYTQVQPGDKIVFMPAPKPPKPPKVNNRRTKERLYPQGHCPRCGAAPSTGTMKKKYEWYTVPELAEALRVHRSTVYQKARSGEWPGIKVGGDWRFDVWAIREMLKQKWSMRL
jgi:excisionase family DNA binding protein